VLSQQLAALKAAIKQINEWQQMEFQIMIESLSQ
jgi:hypothetical protein